MRRTIALIAFSIVAVLAVSLAYRHHLRRVDEAFLTGALTSEVGALYRLGFIRQMAQDARGSRFGKAIEVSMGGSLQLTIELLNDGAELDPSVGNLAARNTCQALLRVRSVEPLFQPSSVPKRVDQIWNRLDCQHWQDEGALTDV